MSLTILAIESSCDDTGVAIVRDGKDLLANVVSSQIQIHQKFGGVVPEVASREHLTYINRLIDKALEEAALSYQDIDLVAVTYGPGLVGALLVGVSTAKALAYAIKKPLLGIHHIEGHIYANFLAHPDIRLPALCLVVSGGHTNIIKINRHGEYLSLGQTRDDAAGEAFDKVARALGLPYPGGPEIDRLFKVGNPEAITFPIAKLDNPYDFSFSGLKSAVLNYLNQEKMKNRPIEVPDVAASFQMAVVKALCEKTFLALENEQMSTLLLAGGVAANSQLRESLAKGCAERGIQFYCPPMAYCTDNAAMIGAAAYYKAQAGQVSDLTLNAHAQLPFSTL
ncbi:tRNA (adenosine(37)-N6)-threonylcarbamoyltransferase complex transferase subunit TsaD [Peptococcus simiae]|uniref:tRNA N6-adenosine threonylcarbamoyltransferase n=1 Tax=Peptococcus simiae TaxID=1643805 RepID=A0ABW9GYV4_9FIRM